MLRNNSDLAEIERVLFSEWSYLKVQKLYGKAKKVDPSIKLNPGVQGIIHLADRKILKALESYQKHKGSIYLEQAQRYARFADKNGTLPEHYFRKLIVEQLRKGSLWSAYFLMNRDILGEGSFNDTEESFYHWLYHFNKKIYRRTFKSTLRQLPSGNYSFSLENGADKVEDFSFLKNLPFETLDLSASAYEHKNDLLLNMPLCYLNLSRTPSQDLDNLPWKSLEYLDVSYSKVEELSFDKADEMNLKVLNIIGCRIRNLESLLACENLKIVHLNKKDYSNSLLKALEDKGVELIDDRP